MLNQITYILLDAARMGDKIEVAKEMNPRHDSLYRGRSEESLAVVAPYLFPFQHNKAFIDWYMDKGWGDSWGVLIKSSYPLDELHKHFRKFLIVGTEDNQQLYFRFYDPRVLRIFLPTCDMGQLREFFGPIEYFVMEDEDPAFAIRCWLENGILHSQKITLENLVQGSYKIASAPLPTANAGNEYTSPRPPSKDIKAPTSDQATFDEPTVKKPPRSKWNMFDD